MGGGGQGLGRNLAEGRGEEGSSLSLLLVFHPLHSEGCEGGSGVSWVPPLKLVVVVGGCF